VHNRIGRVLDLLYVGQPTSSLRDDVAQPHRRHGIVVVLELPPGVPYRRIQPVAQESLPLPILADVAGGSYHSVPDLFRHV